jgi:hypothetical protein
LSNFGIAIGPFLTALGVGSLAVGLALQDTLSNLFAGFYLLASRQVEIGDYLELERVLVVGEKPHDDFFFVFHNCRQTHAITSRNRKNRQNQQSKHIQNLCCVN